MPRNAVVEAGPEDEVVDLYDGEDLSSIRYGQWRANKNGRYLIPRYLGGSDYSGSLVEKSNFNVWSKRFAKGEDEWWTNAPGGHGTYAIVIDMHKVPDKISKDVAETLAALNDYPLLDESAHSELEHEAETEAWGSWAEREFKKALEVHLGDDSLDDVDSDKLYEVFEKAREKANEYWENQSGGDMSIDISRIVKKLSIADMFAIARELDVMNPDLVDMLDEAGYEPSDWPRDVPKVLHDKAEREIGKGHVLNEFGWPFKNKNQKSFAF